MTPQCQQLLDHVGHAPMPRALEEHARSCEVCQGVLEVFGALGSAAVTPSPDRSRQTKLQSQAVAELAQHPKPTPWWRDGILLGGVCVLMALLGVFSGGTHALIGNRAGPVVIFTVAVLLAVTIGWGVYAALMPRGRWHRLALVVFALENALLVGLGGSGVNIDPFWKVGMGCLQTECLLSLLPLVVAMPLLLRIAHDPLRALSAGLAASATGMLALHLHCPCGSAAHLFTFHVAPWFLLSLLFWAIRSRLPSRSYAP